MYFRESLSDNQPVLDKEDGWLSEKSRPSAKEDSLYKEPF